MADSLEFAISRFTDMVNANREDFRVLVGSQKQIEKVLEGLRELIRRRHQITDDLKELAAKTMVLCSSFEHLLEDHRHRHRHRHRASPPVKCCFPSVVCYPARKMVREFCAEMKLLQEDLEVNDFDYSGQDLVIAKKSRPHAPRRTPIWEEKMEMLISWISGQLQPTASAVAPDRRVSPGSAAESSYQAVVISGMGGVGKTALARQFFDSKEIEECYPKRYWIDRPQDLESKVPSVQENDSILLVLDNICSPDEWKALSDRILSWKKVRSTILITTRMREIARTQYWNIHLESLTQEQGCKLFFDGPVFLGEDLRKKIVSYCGGLPVMLASFFRYMSNKHTLEEWEDTVSKRVACTSIIKRLEAPEVQATLEVLASSFDNLQPYILKLIFLYMGVLQVNLRVEVERLYLFCLADGIISSRQPREATLVNFRENYLRALAKKSMFDMDEEDGLKYCQLNEHMRDLAVSKNAEELFFKFVEYERLSQSVPELLLSSLSGNVARFVINFDEHAEECVFPFEDDNEKSQVRVLIFQGRSQRLTSPTPATENISTTVHSTENPLPLAISGSPNRDFKEKKAWSRKFPSFVKFKRLKILYFDGLDFEGAMLPEGIETVVHLRYLGFKDCVVGELPAAIGNLTFLYILDLRVEQSADSSPMIIPDVLWKLKKLKHLFLPISFKPDGASKKLRLYGLTELETITNFNTANFIVEDLLTLPKLHHLASIVYGSLEEIKCIVELMEKKKEKDGASLCISLDIRNFDCYSEKRHSVFRKLLGCKSLQVLRFEGHLHLMPMHDSFSENLTKIELIDSELIDDPMKTLEKLPKLCELGLHGAFLGKEMACSASGFAQLRIMQLSYLLNVEKWTVESGAMPKLRSLAIQNCLMLKTVPERLKSLAGM